MNQQETVIEKEKEKEGKYVTERSFIQLLTHASRGDLAILRRACGMSMNESMNALSTFYKFLPYVITKPHDQERYFLVGTLFATNPSTTSKGNFGDTMKKMVIRGMSKDTMIHRLRSILGCKTWNGTFSSYKEMSSRLRQCTKFTNTHGIGVNWVQLLRDLKYWEHGDKSVQNKWARSFHSYKTDDDNNHGE